VQPAAFGADGFLGSIHGIGERRGARGQRHVVEAACERVPVRVGYLARRLVERLTRELAEGIGVERIERHTDDAAGGDEAGARQVQQAGNELAARKIAGRAEQHDHLWMTRTDAGRNLRHGALPC
jgi:hypothetical protein